MASLTAAVTEVLAGATIFGCGFSTTAVTEVLTGGATFFGCGFAGVLPKLTNWSGLCCEGSLFACAQGGPPFCRKPLGVGFRMTSLALASVRRLRLSRRARS